MVSIIGNLKATQILGELQGSSTNLNIYDSEYATLPFNNNTFTINGKNKTFMNHIINLTSNNLNTELIIDEYLFSNFPSNCEHTIFINNTSNFKIILKPSVHCFIDNESLTIYNSRITYLKIQQLNLDGIYKYYLSETNVDKKLFKLQDFLSDKLPFGTKTYANSMDNLNYCKIYNHHSLFTIGEKRNNYYLTGVPDGLGGYLLSDEIIRMFMVSEIDHTDAYAYKLKNGTMLTGARVQFIDFNRRTLEVINCGLAYDKIYNSDYQLVTPDNLLNCVSYIAKDASNNNTIINNTKGLTRFCSASYYPKHYWNKNNNENNGFEDNIFFTGEEPRTNVTLLRGGLVWALDISDNSLHAMPKLGRGSFENVASIDVSHDNYIGLVTSRESTQTRVFKYNSNDVYTNGGAFILLYIGQKQFSSNNFLSRNGLKEGQMYVMFLKGNNLTLPTPNGENNYTGENIDVVFVPIPDFEDDVVSFYNAVRSTSKPGYTLYTANTVEDLCSNPENGCEFIYAHERSSQIEYVKFDTPNLNNGFPSEITGISKVLFKNTNVMSQCDNLFWSKNGKIFVQEDNYYFSSLPMDNNKLLLNSDNTYKENTSHILYLKFLYKNINDANSGYIGNYERIIKTPNTQYNINISELMNDTPKGSVTPNETSGITDITPLMVLHYGHTGKDFRENLDGKFMLYDVQAHGLTGGKIEREQLSQGGQILLLSLGYSSV